MEQHKSFAGACKAFFGFKSGQSLREFMEEIKQLTPDDRAEIAEGLKMNGHEILEP